MKATISFTLAFSALALSGVGFVCAQKAPLVSYASTPSAHASLLSPSYYEEYLALSAPSDVAATSGYTAIENEKTEGFMAIADGKNVHVFDCADGVYRTYSHGKEVRNLAFYDADTLLFSDSSTKLYKLSLTAFKNGGTAEKLVSQDGDVSCSTFTAHDGYVYYTTTVAGKTTLFSLSMDGAVTRELLSIKNETPLAYDKGALYYVHEREGFVSLLAISPQAQSIQPINVTCFERSVRSMAFVSNLFCMVTEDGDFYSYDFATLKTHEFAADAEIITHETKDFVSVSSNGNTAYTVRKNAVLAYLAESAVFSDHEICAASSSQGRLRDATDLLLHEDKLFIADGGNQRVSVYNVATNAYEREIPTTANSPLMASNGETLLLADSSQATLYDLSKTRYGEVVFTIEDAAIEGNVIGAASVYDCYYLLTDKNYCYALQTSDSDWTYTETQKKLPHFAVALTADVYGSLYVAYNDDGIYRFTEKELLDPSENGVRLVSHLSDVEKLGVDYETNVYALTDGTTVKYTANAQGEYAESARFTPDYHLVNDATPKVCAFTFGVESADAYLLYDGDYIVKTDEWNVPVVNPIPVGNAAQIVFGEQPQSFSAVTVAEDTILIAFDIQALQTATVFPYLAFQRTQTAQRALKLGEEGDYSILVLTDERTGKQSAYLAPSKNCTALEESDYRVRYTEPIAGYVTNDVSLYKFPYLTELLTVGQVVRNSEVKIVGKIYKLDHAYYEIEIPDGNGNVKIGYVPKNYVTFFNGAPPVPSEEIYGEQEADTDAIWRCVYILLGLGAICILVDFLILHKPKQEE